MPTTAQLEGMLRDASLHVTRPRVAVLAAVHHHPHADTYSLISHARDELGAVSQQAVYDVLKALTDAGLLHDPFPGVRPPRLDQIRGRGLWLARTLCEAVDVRVDSTGTRVRLTAAPEPPD